MKILITGGTGFIGSALAARFIDQGHHVTILSRSPENVLKMFPGQATPLKDFDQLSSEDAFDVVVNLAGAPIFGQRWSDKRKKVLRDSRIGLTEQLVKAIATMPSKPELLLSGSAIGYYGDRGDEILTERSAGGSDFSHDLCADWEQAALKAESMGVRICVLRTGLVLGAGGGLLQRMLPSFRLGLGGKIGHGKQWMSWVHLTDWLNMAELMIADKGMHGAYNMTAPNPVTNRTFIEILAKTLHRPANFLIPAFALRLLLGEMSELVLGSQRVMPDRIKRAGYQFQFESLETALKDILG